MCKVSCARSFRLWIGGFVMLFLLLPIGCGSSVASVSGKISYKNQVVKGGTVTFYDANQWTGSSHIAEDGTYSINNVPLGTVEITVETKTAKPNPNMSKFMPKPPPGADMPPGSFHTTGGQKERYVEIPDSYAEREKSGLRYEVKKGGKQVHDIDLK